MRSCGDGGSQDPEPVAASRLAPAPTGRSLSGLRKGFTRIRERISPGVRKSFDHLGFCAWRNQGWGCSKTDRPIRQCSRRSPTCGPIRPGSISTIAATRSCHAGAGVLASKPIASYRRSRSRAIGRPSARRRPLARCLPPRLLPARSARFPTVLLRLDHGTDEAARIDPAVRGSTRTDAVAIDSKAQRGSARRTVGQSALHVVSAWAVENRLTLG